MKVTKFAAAYIRMSTDDQKDSPARQRAEIEALAKREGFTIVEWYEDHGMTGTESTKRKGWQKLLKDGKAGKFATVLLYEQSRMSREDVFAFMRHLEALSDAKVEIWTCQRGRMQTADLGGLLQAIIEAHGSREEVIKFASRSCSGKRHKVNAGNRVIATRVFGYDRQVKNASGELVQTVSFRENFRRPSDWQQTLVISGERKAVAAVRFMFDKYCEAWPVARIRDTLQKQGIYPQRKQHWTNQSIIRILSNQTYCGDTVVGGNPKGEFACVFDELTVLANTHEPIIGREQFERVQALLAIRQKVTNRKKRTEHILTGLLRCGCCGQPMHGSFFRRGGKVLYRHYRCSSNSKKLDNACTGSTCLVADAVEALVVRLAFDHAEESRKLTAAMEQKQAEMENGTLDESSVLRRELKELQAKQGVIADNFAFATDPTTRALTQQKIANLADRVAAIKATLADDDCHQKLAPEVHRAAGLKGTRLNGKNNEQIGQALLGFVKAVFVQRTSTADGYRVTAGRIEFYKGLGLSDITFSERDDLAAEPWLAMRDFLIAEYPREVPCGEIIEALGITGENRRHQRTYVSGWGRTGVKHGWLIKCGWNRWAAVSPENRPAEHCFPKGRQRAVIAS